jgi:[acyl-carrier-protein] S-malonyltransferase
MASFKNIAFLFPGQGAQYVKMGKDFYDTFSICRETFQEADDILGRSLSKVIFEAPEEELTQTRSSQTAIYVMSMAIQRLLKKEFSLICPQFAAGLSLGEYTALTASEKISFKDCLPLVQKRGELMNEACLSTKGSMAVIMGLNADVVEAFVKELNLPNDLWVANFNCPGQVVISGTMKGIELGMEKAKAVGAKRAMPLQVHGAFHSGLMAFAQENLRGFIESVKLKDSKVDLVMNVTGLVEKDLYQIRQNLIKQVTHSVRWEMGIHTLEQSQVDLYIEMGPGKTLAGMNKRIGVKAQTISIEKVEDLKLLEAIQ